MARPETTVGQATFENLQEKRIEEPYWLCPSPFIVTYFKVDYMKKDDMRRTYNTHITCEN